MELIKQNILVNGATYEYFIYYKYKRSIFISINKKNQIIVRGSKLVSKDRTIEFIKKNIEKMYFHLKQRKSMISIKYNFITLFDQRCELMFKIGKRNKYFKRKNNIHITYTKENKKIQIIKKIYNDEMRKNIKLNKNIKNFISSLNVKPKEIAHKWLVGKWGYCTMRNKKIVLSDLLTCFNQEYIDYVILHELTHLLVFNHSKKFWDIVNIYFPNYKQIRKNMKNINVEKK